MNNTKEIEIRHWKPIFATEQIGLTPVSDHLRNVASIPPSRMFILKNSLATYREKYPGKPVYDASQGDGGASLPGVAHEILTKAYELQIEQGTSYDQPHGAKIFRHAVIENYWKLDPGLGYGPENVVAAVGGRDALLKAYQAMMVMGYGRQGDVLIVSRVPWISYTWGPFGIGANVLLAPGTPEESWAYSKDAIRESVAFSEREGRKVAGMVITSPDNPTGRTLSPEFQAELAHEALRAGVSFVLFDWMYHFVTDEKPMDLNAFLSYFDSQERERLIFLDGLTKSMGASNIRNAHLIASKSFINQISAVASHGVIPPFYAQAVAIVSYRMGFQEACRPITEPTNASRKVLDDYLSNLGMNYILGKGYYAFIDVGEWLDRQGWKDSEKLGEYLALEHGLAVVPGVFFSPAGNRWIRFSYATPPATTLSAVKALDEGLRALE